MFSTDDTIVAIATPPGRGGIGVVRLSGPDAHSIARRIISRDEPLKPRHATLTIVNAIDEAVATYFPAPASYTGEDVVELSAHGSPVVLRAIVAAAVDSGARLAEPGEFTFRAFLNGRLDLPQAESVADLIDAVTPLQARAAFDQLQGTLTRAIGEIDDALFDLIARLEASIDFSEEGYHFIESSDAASAIAALLARTTKLLAGARGGRLVREGLQIAIVGAPNVGKSSLFNALAGASRAIVTDVPGTTRDLVTDVVDLDGLRVTLVDTAGLRTTTDLVEAEGVARARDVQRVVDLVLHVLDGSRALDAEALAGLRDAVAPRRLVVVNKSDLPLAWNIDELREEEDITTVSAVTGTGLDALKRRIVAALDVELQADRPTITNVRHAALVQQAHDALTRAHSAASSASGPLPEEFVLADLQEARAALEEVSGRRTPDDVLAHIFANFCIGK